ncbi:MAG: apolipoprotein A1/A4/E family protein [Gammaproteobacteria bacterium]|nr:apolipoprotein A1/A4/E family protein [Gammaproteobacteria bacterium]
MLNSVLTSLPTSLLVTGSILALLVVAFLIFFLGRGVHLRYRLWSLLKQLRIQKTQNPSDLQKLFQSDEKFDHLWKEFRDTLHAQTEQRDGQMVVVAHRATMPAESFFNSQYLVDSQLHTEFFKHLPGLFTGIGIIGTFLGLIRGLQAFQVSEDAGQVRASLELLLHGVFEAFLISAAAIALAMVVTFLEKLLLASLYRCTEDIAQHLDSLFVSGAGEEYLSRLVTASEDSASQAKILKDSLVGEMKTILRELTERQIEAQIANNKDLGQQIAGNIQSSLQGPLETIKDLVTKASGDQSSAAAEMLKDVMTSFSQRLNDLFGGQISGIQELNQKSAQAMQDAVQSLHELIGNMEVVSQRSGDAMAEAMTKAIDDMGRRQDEINKQTQSMIEQIRQLVATSQTETNDKLQAVLGDLSKQVSDVVGALQSQSRQAHETQQQREENFVGRTERVVTSLGESVSEVVKQMAESTSQMQQSIAALERTTSNSIDKMSAGAETLKNGAVAFALAGENVSKALSQATTVANKMTEVSGSLTTSASALQAVIADYRANRDATGSMLTEVRAIVETAKREASMTQSALDQIQRAADKLAAAQGEAEHYLDNVSKVLADAHQAFADGVTVTLERANQDFHTKLSSAVGLLSGAIKELQTTIDSFDPPRH